MGIKPSLHYNTCSAYLLLTCSIDLIYFLRDDGTLKYKLAK